MDKVNWDKKALGRALAQDAGVMAAVQSATQNAAARANSLGSGFRTEVVHIKGKKVGGTPARYEYNVKRQGSVGVPVGIVHPANYAAYKDILKNNTLAKVL